MATNFNAGQDNYTGEVLDHLLTLTAQENETYKEGLIHIKTGIQKKYAIPMVKLGKIIQDRKPIPDASKGDYEHAERHLEPNDFMIYLRFNPRDYEKYYRPFQPTGNLVYRQLDPKVQATMAQLLLEKKNEYINHSIWCAATSEEAAKVSSADGKVSAGNTEIGGEDEAGDMKYFNGAIMRMLLNAAAAPATEDAKSGKILVAGTGTFADGEAVEKELYAMWKATPPKIRKKAELKILMDYKSWDAYDQYLSSKTVKYSDNRSENEHRFHGKRIVPMVALPDDTIIIGVFTTGEDSNLWMGIDYVNDENVLQVDKLQNDSELYFFKMLLKMDVNIVRPSEITVHLPFAYGAAAGGGAQQGQGEGGEGGDDDQENG